MANFTKEQIDKLEKMQYGICAKHSSVQLCSWNKKALVNKGVCYKEHFYGIDCHRCAQITPATLYCNHNCIFCWRPMEYMKPDEFIDFDKPEEIIEECVKKRKKLLSGFLGNLNANKEKVKSAYYDFPSHFAISLSGEPTLYPLLLELIKKLREKKQVKSVFLVTNGQVPDNLKKLYDFDGLPHQLYVSIESADKKTYELICNPINKDGFKNLKKTLKMIKKLNEKTRTIIRFTLIKGINDEKIESLAKLFDNTFSDFIEIKAYMYLGFSRKRLTIENMPTHKQVQEFTNKILKKSKNYYLESQHPPSRITLLKRKDCIKKTKYF